MAHNLLTSTPVTRKAVKQLIELTPFLMHLARPEEDYFNRKGVAKSGGTYTIKKPARFLGRQGDAMDTENIVQEQVTMTLDPLWGTDVEITDREETLDLDGWAEVTEPAMERIGADMEAYYKGVATKACFNSVGTPGTAINNDLLYLNMGSLLTEHGAPKANRMICASDRQISALVNANKALFHQDTQISSQYKEGTITGRAHGFLWYTSTSLLNFTTGTYTGGTPLVNGASQSGTSLITDGWNSGATTLQEGDVFYIADVFGVYPQNRISTGQLQAFAVGAQISDTAGAITMTISPEIKGPGDPHQNVDALPANDAIIFFQGSTSGSPVQNSATASVQTLACHKLALQFTTAALPDHPESQESMTSTHKGTNVSVRIWKDSDIRAGSNLARFDVLAGMAIPYAELLARGYQE